MKNIKKEVLKEAQTEDTNYDSLRRLHPEFAKALRTMITKDRKSIIHKTLAKVSEVLDDTKIIKSEICMCEHSKVSHLPHQLDKHGGRCMICVNCSIYTWKEFEFVDLKELKKEIGI